MAFKIAVLKETRANERRVALVPVVADKLTKLGATLAAQTGAGDAVKLPDAAFKNVHFAANPQGLVSDADIVLAVQPPSLAAVDAMKGDEVDVTVAGSGTLDIGRVDATRLSATIAGSGDLEVAGRADRGRITIAGSGGIDGRQLQVGGASVSIAGSGDARFRANGRVSASIVGSGHAMVTGTTDCTQSRMGSGHLTCTR